MSVQPPIAPPRWTGAELDIARLRAIDIFRAERLAEPLDAYARAFAEYHAAVEAVLDATHDLRALGDSMSWILKEAQRFEVFRYLAAPPISLDDLKTLVGESSLSARRLRALPDLASRLRETVRAALDRQRFPWVSEGREPRAPERAAAVLASAALLASSRVETLRRNAAKKAQEQRVKAALLHEGFVEVRPRRVRTLGDAPEPGQFCGEARFGERKADVIVGLWDGRKLLLECKVSNSATNSIKRFNNDVAAKADKWLSQFGTLQVVPAAVLSGVYHLHQLEAAQQRVPIFWAHALEELIHFVQSTSPPPEDPGDAGAPRRG